MSKKIHPIVLRSCQDGDCRHQLVSKMSIEFDGPPTHLQLVKLVGACLHTLVHNLGRSAGRSYAQSVIPEGAVGVEIGVDQGDGLKGWLDAGADHVFAVDPFLDQDFDPWYNCGQEEMDDRYERIQRRYGKDDRVSICRMKSDEYFDDMSVQVDFVHIDGDHREDACFRDMVHAFECLKPGGLLMVDDTHCRLWEERIGRAVERFEAEYGDHLEMVQDEFDPLIYRVKEE